MRNTPLAASLCFTLLNGFAQNPVPNPSFENWTAGDPDEWTIQGVGAPSPTVVQVTTAFSGNYALKGQVVLDGGFPHAPYITSTAFGFSGFPVSQAYAFLRFHYIHAPIALSDLIVMVDMLDSSGFVGYAYEVISGSTETYTSMTIPLAYTGMPTECVIHFWLGNVELSTNPYFILDDVELFGNAMDTPEPDAPNIGRIHPNPASDRITIDLPSDARGQLRITDAQGRACLERQLNGGAQVIDLDLPPGIYTVTSTTAEDWSTQRLVVE